MTERQYSFLAVYLLAMGEKIIALQVQPEDIFRFAASSTLQGHIGAYRADTALVNPKVFARQIMQLRQQLHQHRQQAK